MSMLAWLALVRFLANPAEAVACSDLVEVLPSEERLIFLFAEVDGEGLGLGPFLPHGAGAVPGQGVVPDLMVVGVPARQNAAPARAAERRGREL